MRSTRAGVAAALVAVTCACLAPAALAQGVTKAGLQRQLEALVAADGGPPGAIVTLRRGSRMTTLRAGVADVETGRKRSPGLRVARDDPELGREGAARLHSGQPLRVFEYRQHCRRPHGRASRRSALWPAAARDCLQAARADAHELPEQPAAPAAVHTRLPGRPGLPTRGREHAP